MSDPEFYVSSYYSGCSHEQTRDRLGGCTGSCTGDEQEASTYDIYVLSPYVINGHCLGISSVHFPFFCLETVFLKL